MRSETAKHAARQCVPAVDVDGEELVVVDAPVLALADEFSEHRERDVFRRDGHLFATVALEVIPLAVVLGRKPTLRYRRRQQICINTAASCDKKTRNLLSTDKRRSIMLSSLVHRTLIACCTNRLVLIAQTLGRCCTLGTLLDRTCSGVARLQSFQEKILKLP